MSLNACRVVTQAVRAGMVDMETGELLEGMPILDRQKARHYWEATFVVTFQEALNSVKSELSGEEARMLLHILSSLGMNNEWVILNQREVAAVMKMSQSQVSRSLRTLTEKQVITKGTRIGKGYAYSFNPNLGWKGPFKNHAFAKHSAPKLVLLHSRDEVAA